MGHQAMSPSSMPTDQSHLAPSLRSWEPSSMQERRLKRSPAHLSVCLRPTPSKRLKPMNRTQHVEAASTTISASSMDFAARRLHRARQNLSRYRSTSGGLRRANAERWFNDSNQNPTHTRHASFIDSKPAMFPSAVETQPCQMILRSIYATNPQQRWIVPVQFYRTGTLTAGGTLLIPGRQDEPSRARAPVRSFEG